MSSADTPERAGNTTGSDEVISTVRPTIGPVRTRSSNPGSIIVRSLLILAPLIISFVVVWLPSLRDSGVPLATFWSRAEIVAMLFGFIGAVLQFLPNLLDWDEFLLPWHYRTTSVIKSVGFTFIASAFFLLFWTRIALLGGLQNARWFALALAGLFILSLIVTIIVRRAQQSTLLDSYRPAE